MKFFQKTAGQESKGKESIVVWASRELVMRLMLGFASLNRNLRNPRYAAILETLILNKYQSVGLSRPHVLPMSQEETH